MKPTTTSIFLLLNGLDGLCRVIVLKKKNWESSMNRSKDDPKVEPPPVKTNEANLEELNKKIVEIKRKIVLSGESQYIH